MRTWLTILPIPLLLVLSLTPARAGDDIDKAWDAWKEDHLKAALQRVNAILEREPDNAEAHGLLAKVQYDLGLFEQALTEARRAYELDPEDWPTLHLRYAAWTAFFYGRDDACRKALKTYEKGHKEYDKRLPGLMDPPGLFRKKKKKGHYIVYTDKELRDRGGLGFTVKMMELIYSAYSKVFPFDKDEQLINRVYVFGSQKNYWKFNLAATGKEKRGASGYFSLVTRILVVNAAPRGRPSNKYGFTVDVIDTLFHEGFHQFALLHVPQSLPDWYGEGFAEYFGPSTVRGKKKLNVGVVIKRDPRAYTRYERIREVLSTGQPVPALSMKDFLQQTDAEFHESDARAQVNYAQAWSVVHFLVQGMGKKGRKVAKSYFLALKEGKTQAEAFGESFGKLNLEKVDRAWRRYLARL